MSQHIFSNTPSIDSNGPSSKNQAKQKEPNEFERQTLVNLYTANRFAEAEALAQMLIERFPKHPLAWKVLGAVLKQMGRLDEALVPMKKAIALSPRDWQAHNNIGVALKALGKTDEAMAAYRRAIALQPDFAEAHANLGEALRTKGLLPDALQCYRRKVALTPDDQDAQFLVQLLSGEQVERPPEAHVKGIFDHYAATFETHLVNQLSYRVPLQLGEFIAASPLGQRQDLRVLDLGCGTGLIGDVLKPYASELVGVDLSPKMLEQAAHKNVYHRLVCADLDTMMRSEPSAHYDLIVAADVFVYLGQLEGVIEQAKRLLKPQGQLYFSVESLDQPDGRYFLQPCGRYSHALSYLNELQQAHHFDLLSCTPTALRTDNLQPIAGHLLAWQA
ncbi:MAG: tetratricopeptide repeat protein [Burkholderiales bacterium]|nr:tetratricopeptide repeat protein [Burkholderiales bacterium]